MNDQRAEKQAAKDDDRCTHGGAYEVRREGNTVIYYCPGCQSEYVITLR